MKLIRQIGSLAFVIGVFCAVFFGIPWYVMVSDDPVLPWWFKTAIFCLLGGIVVVLVTVAFEQRKTRKSAVDAFTTESDHPDMLLTSTALNGSRISETFGLVQGHTVYAIWLGKDLSAIIRLILGGELTEYTEMMGRARDAATKRMVTRAADLGADAVINIRYMTTSVVGSAAELLVYGTAVKLGKASP
jgi:uncharacterized protein YbjQ (UPF0145 family)